MAGQPDLNAILKEVKSIHAILDDHENRITDVERWKIATIAAEQAIAKYKQDNPPLSERRTIFGEGVNTELVKLIGQALGIIGGLVTLVYWALQEFVK